jgi:hypothetical protein
MQAKTELNTSRNSAVAKPTTIIFFNPKTEFEKIPLEKQS